MKKFILVIFVIITLFILNNISTTTAVINYETSDDNIYLLDFTEENLSTNNFKLKIAPFTGYTYEIRRIVPKHNTNLKKYYTYDFSNLDEGTENFKKDYINILKKNNLFDEIEKVYLDGVEISKVEIYSTKEALVKFLKKYPKVKYKIITSDYKSI